MYLFEFVRTRYYIATTKNIRILKCDDRNLETNSIRHWWTTMQWKRSIFIIKMLLRMYVRLLLYQKDLKKILKRVEHLVSRVLKLRNSWKVHRNISCWLDFNYFFALYFHRATSRTQRNEESLVEMNLEYIVKSFVQVYWLHYVLITAKSFH